MKDAGRYMIAMNVRSFIALVSSTVFFVRAWTCAASSPEISVSSRMVELSRREMVLPI